MALRRPGFSAELSSSCDVFDRAARSHAQNVGTSATPTRTVLAQCVRRARIAAGLTQENAALDLGVDVRTLRRWESGTHLVDVEVLHDAPKMGPAWRVQHDLMFSPTRVYPFRRAA